MTKKQKKEKVKKLTIKELQDKIWIEVRRIIKNRELNECYTCGAQNLVGSNCQVGHMIPKAYLKNYLKYDLRLLKFQCMRCNLRLGGNGALFITKMRQIEGDEYVDGILKDLKKEIEPKLLYGFYENLLAKYKLL